MSSGDQMQYATRAKKMYLRRFAQLIQLLGRKQAEALCYGKGKQWKQT